MSVVEAVVAELEDLDASGSALGATAVVLAEQLDGLNSATSKSMCAKALVDVMGQIRASAPPRKQEDRVDEIAKRRERRVRGAGAAG